MSQGSHVPVPRACIICCGSPAPLCSDDCRQAALHERDENVRWLALLSGSTGDSDLRVALAARNGRLTAGLLQWRPGSPPERRSSRSA